GRAGRASSDPPAGTSRRRRNTSQVLRNEPRETRSASFDRRTTSVEFREPRYEDRTTCFEVATTNASRRTPALLLWAGGGAGPARVAVAEAAEERGRGRDIKRLAQGHAGGRVVARLGVLDAGDEVLAHRRDAAAGTEARLERRTAHRLEADIARGVACHRGDAAAGGPIFEPGVRRRRSRVDRRIPGVVGKEGAAVAVIDGGRRR